jgi:hypothetical protein
VTLPTSGYPSPPCPQTYWWQAKKGRLFLHLRLAPCTFSIMESYSKVVDRYAGWSQVVVRGVVKESSQP